MPRRRSSGMRGWRSVVVAGTVMCALCARPALPASQPEVVEPEVLALAKEVANERANRLWHLYDDALSRPLSLGWMVEDKWLFGFIRDYLIAGNPGREDDVYEFINRVFRPVILQTRDEFVCLTARRVYRTEMSFVEKKGSATEGERQERLRFIQSNRKTVMLQAHRFQMRGDLYHFIWLNWGALKKENFRLYAIKEPGLDPDLRRELDYPAIDYLERTFFDSSSPCGAPWAS